MAPSGGGWPVKGAKPGAVGPGVMLLFTRGIQACFPGTPPYPR